MKRDEQDELWNLLGKARAPKERPFFAGKVLRAIEEESAVREIGILAWIRRWMLPVAAGACAAAVAVFAFGDSDNRKGGPAPMAVAPKVEAADPLKELATAVAETDELDVTIDGLLAGEDNSVWLYADPSSLY